jgi:transposase
MEMGSSCDIQERNASTLLTALSGRLRRICLTNNAAERALRCIAIGRRNWTFCGSDRGGERAAAIYTLVATAKLNDIDPEAWLADVLRRINDHPASRLHELLPWNWRKPNAEKAEAA